MNDWKNKFYKEGTKVLLLNKDKKPIGVGKLKTKYPSDTIIISFNEKLLFGGVECYWIPIEEIKNKSYYKKLFHS